MSQTLSVSEIDVVTARHDALNRGGFERLTQLSHPDIEVGGPRGSGQGTRLLREWVPRTGIRRVPIRNFHQGDTVVVQQEAKWRSVETGELSGSRYVACIFVVRDELVVSVLRYPDLADALRAADLDGSHEVPSDYRAVARGPGGGEIEKP